MPPKDRRFDEERIISPPGGMPSLAPRPAPLPPALVEALRQMLAEELRPVLDAASAAARRAHRIEVALAELKPEEPAAGPAPSVPPMRPRLPTHRDREWADQSARIELGDPYRGTPPPAPPPQDPKDLVADVLDDRELAASRQRHERLMDLAKVILGGAGAYGLEHLVQLLIFHH